MCMEGGNKRLSGYAQREATTWKILEQIRADK